MQPGNGLSYGTLFTPTCYASALISSSYEPGVHRRNQLHCPTERHTVQRPHRSTDSISEKKFWGIHDTAGVFIGFPIVVLTFIHR